MDGAAGGEEDVVVQLDPEFLQKKATKKRIYIADRVVNGVTEKCCTRCGQWKTHEHFCKNGARLRSCCRPCKSEVDKERLAKTPQEDKQAYYRAYYLANRERRLAYQAAYREQNEEKLRLRRKQYWAENAERLRPKVAQWHRENRAHVMEYQRRNRARINANALKNQRRRMTEDPQFRVAKNMRTSVWRAVRKFNATKVDSTSELLGCTMSEFAGRLEAMWLPGMNWDNYGEYRRGKQMTWHIDHIIPVTWFDLNDPEQQRQCFHHTNLQPMWATDNMSKCNRFAA